MTTKIGNKTVDEDMKELFGLFDLDNKGQIDEKKLLAACKESGIKISEDEIKLMLGEADIDNKGSVNEIDFRRIMRRGYNGE